MEKWVPFRRKLLYSKKSNYHRPTTPLFLSGDGNYFIGGLVNDGFYDYYGGTFRSDYSFYSPRQGGNSFQA